jgi:hypothetical protein
MVKILIQDRLYNIKDEDYKKLRETNFEGKNYNNFLTEIEKNYKIKDYIQCHNYLDINK